ncbi:hypothetical protein HN789_04230 [archaeon]|jgi:hypothetical protein|nr:hypothetical protein [archaeon]MBT4023150.1 hypothetical protein [archaeon]MBT4271847.1 hypothetical protein [archaeon]MBT4460735.1 hypothetical protein [archaeon]MBT4859094.1 hypothetical protein [archaeon]
MGVNKNQNELKRKLATYFLLAFGFVISGFVIMLLFNVSDYGITIASFGATIFMILSRSNLSKKKVYGSYMLAAAIGFLFSKITTIASLNLTLATVSSFVIMTLLEFQHAPALGLSMAMVLNKFPLMTDIIILCCILFIITMTIVLKVVLQKPEKVLAVFNLDRRKIKWDM